MNVFLPGDLFVAGYNAGLLTNGQTVPGSARVSVEPPTRWRACRTRRR
jgi:hypothetical protein